MHGYDHRPGGFDAIPTGAWVSVTSSPAAAWSGSTTYSPGNKASQGVYEYMAIQKNKNIQPGTNAQWAFSWVINRPIFQSPWGNSGGGLQGMRFRISVGYPNFLDKYTNAVITFVDHQIDLEGSVSGGTYSTIVFYLPQAYWPENHLRLPASDDVGGFVPFTVKNDGSVWKGIAP